MCVHMKITLKTKNFKYSVIIMHKRQRHKTLNSNILHKYAVNFISLTQTVSVLFFFQASFWSHHTIVVLTISYCLKVKLSVCCHFLQQWQVIKMMLPLEFMLLIKMCENSNIVSSTFVLMC